MSFPRSRNAQPRVAAVSFTPDSGIGIYLRKSTERQGDLSLPAQERLIRERIVSSSTLPVYRVYKDVFSGRSPQRHDYQQMLADARAGRLRMVVFHKVNRFGRNAAEGLQAIEELRRLGVAIRVADMPTLDLATPTGMFVFTFLLGQGQYEVENLATEASKGMIEMARRGGWPFRAPDSYRNGHEEIANRKYRCWVVPERPRAAIVRLLFRWYDRENISLLTLAQRLNALHAQRSTAGKGGCSAANGGRWQPQYLHHILTNPFYVGRVVIPVWSIDVPGQHRPIIAAAQFARVQQKLHANGPGATQQHTYPLQGAVRLDGTTPLAGTTVQRNGRVYRYYYHVGGTRRRYFPADAIEQAVVAQCRTLLHRLGHDPAAQLHRHLQHHIAAIRAEAQARHAALAAERKRLLHLATKGRFTEAEVDAELVRLRSDAEHATRDGERAGLLEPMRDQMLAEAAAQIAVIQQWSASTPTEQRAALMALVQSVDVNQEGTVTRVRWHLLWDMIAFPQHYEGVRDG